MTPSPAMHAYRFLAGLLIGTAIFLVLFTLAG